MNFPYFMLHILQNMATSIQQKPNSRGSSLYHHALIKLMFIKEVEKSQVTWSPFLKEKGFNVAKDLHPPILQEVAENPRPMYPFMKLVKK